MHVIEIVLAYEEWIKQHTVQRKLKSMQGTNI